MTANAAVSNRNMIASQDGKRPNLLSTKYIEAKENRKKVEREYQDVLNRIIKLEEEEARIKRKIVQGKRQKSIFEEKRKDVSKRKEEKSVVCLKEKKGSPSKNNFANKKEAAGGNSGNPTIIFRLKKSNR